MTANAANRTSTASRTTSASTAPKRAGGPAGREDSGPDPGVTCAVAGFAADVASCAAAASNAGCVARPAHVRTDDAPAARAIGPAMRPAAITENRPRSKASPRSIGKVNASFRARPNTASAEARSRLKPARTGRAIRPPRTTGASRPSWPRPREKKPSAPERATSHASATTVTVPANAPRSATAAALRRVTATPLTARPQAVVPARTRTMSSGSTVGSVRMAGPSEPASAVAGSHRSRGSAGR